MCLYPHDNPRTTSCNSILHLPMLVLVHRTRKPCHRTQLPCWKDILCSREKNEDAAFYVYGEKAALHQFSVPMIAQKTNLSMLTERSPQAWRPARTNWGMLWFGCPIWGLLWLQLLVSVTCSPWSSWHASNATAASVSLERTWQVTVLGTLNCCFSTLQKQREAICSNRNQLGRCQGSKTKFQFDIRHTI